MVASTTLISTYARALISNADPATPQIQYILGLGDGTGGWSPRYPFLLTKCYMDGLSYASFVNATNAREHQFIVWKDRANDASGAHGAATDTTGDRLYKLAHPVDTTNEEYSVVDTTPKLVLPGEYLTAAVGHDLEDNKGLGGNRSGTLDSCYILQGHYLPVGGGNIGADGYHTWFHLNGTLQAVVKFFMVGQGLVSDPGGLGIGTPQGFVLDRDVIVRRVAQYFRVTSPPVSSPTSAINQIELTVLADGLADPADVVLQTTRQVAQTTAVNSDLASVAVGSTRVSAGSELYVTLEQYRTQGTGTAQISNLNVWVELEEV